MSFIARIIIGLSLLSGWHSASANSLQGAWQLIAGEYIDAQGQTISYSAADMQSIKILSAQHFSFTSVKGQQFWASATGTYQFTNGQYVESLLLNSFGENAGSQFAFEAKIEGDTWYNSRWHEGKRVEYEVWQRLIP